jgi:ATP-dependent Clp protease ATP-binding subunit ClpX
MIGVGEPNSCNFCGKLREEVQALIAGGTAAVCDECIGQCSELLTKAQHAATNMRGPTNPEDDGG